MTILARTRHVYESYRDFWRLVEASGLPTCYVDEIDLQADETYIFTPMNGEMMPRLESFVGRTCRIVWWNLERPSDETLESSLAKLEGKVDAIWVSDRAYAALDSRFTYVPIAGHPAFGTRTEVRAYDVCHLSYLWGRRQSAVLQLEARGVKVASEAYGRAQQDAAVARSHLMLNLHQYEGRTVAPLRFAVAASYAIPIVSESFDDGAARDQVVYTGSIPEIVNAIPVMLKSPGWLAAEGIRLHRMLCLETDFGREVEIASGKVGRR